MSAEEMALMSARWNQQAVRACMLCDHGSGPDTARRCRHPEVAGQAGELDVHLARANAGPCGPEARHMYFPGLHAR